MTGDFDRRIVGQFEIEELDPEVGKSLFGLRQNARVAFSSNMVEGHLNASFHGKGMAVFLAEAGSLVFGEVGEPADSKRSDRFNVVVENKMRGLVVIAIEDERRGDAMFMDKANASQDHSVTNMFGCRCDLASQIWIFRYHRSASLSGHSSSSSQRSFREGQRFQGVFQK